MVSFWPWKGNDTPASFEKALSTLSTKISKSQLQLDKLRQRSRKLKALWALYTTFAYLLCSIILVLVVGWQNWGILEYTMLSGSPLIIYLVRAGIAAYYTFRIDSVTQRLEEQQAERTKTIEKLKTATKYNSTQQLLEKYGGSPPQPSPKSKAQGSRTRSPRSNEKQPQPQRTGMSPPPTANIPRNGPQNIPQNCLPSTPVPVSHEGPFDASARNSPASSNMQPGPPEFAPNAIAPRQQYSYGSDRQGGNWYDRILDLLLGEDETSPKNRMALICQHCKLVNGQAPPGVKDVGEVGRWRCMGCGGSNGEEDEGQQIVKALRETEHASIEHSAAVNDDEHVGSPSRGNKKDTTNEVEPDPDQNETDTSEREEDSYADLPPSDG